MTHRHEPVVDVQVSTEFFEHLVVKLPSIVCDDGMSELEMVDDGPLEEGSKFAFCYMHQGLCLHPLGEVVNGDG